MIRWEANVKILVSFRLSQTGDAVPPQAETPSTLVSRLTALNLDSKVVRPTATLADLIPYNVTQESMPSLKQSQSSHVAFNDVNSAADG